MSVKNTMLSRILSAFQIDFQSDPATETIYEGQSTHNHITIMDEGSRRTMYFGPNAEEAETSIDLSNPEKAVFEYPGLMLTALPIHPSGHRIAMIGLGGGFIPNLFRQHLPDFELTVVELDLLVSELAQTYFGFLPGGNVRLVVDDGREYLNRQPQGAFDQIWLDAFSGNYVPPQLSGLEFLRLCQDRLTPGGLLVQNLHQSRARVFQNQIKTTEVAFGEFLALEGHRCGNTILIAQNPGAPPLSSWKKTAFTTAAKNFKPQIGPYNMLEEMDKIKEISPDLGAVVIE